MQKVVERSNIIVQGLGSSWGGLFVWLGRPRGSSAGDGKEDPGSLVDR